MRLAVYGAVLVIALGSALLGLDWLSTPMSPMVDTPAGLRATGRNTIIAGDSKREYRCADRSTQSRRACKPHRPGHRRRRGAGRRRDCCAGAGSALQYRCLRCSLSLFPHVGLHLPADQRAAAALHEIGTVASN